MVFATHWHESTMVCICSLSWTPLPPPSPSDPSGSSQCTSPEHTVSCIEPALAICFTYDNMHVSMLFLEKAMAAHSSTLAWKIPWTEEPGTLQSMGSLRVRHNWETSLSLFTFIHWRRKWQPTPVVLAWWIPGTGEPGGLPSMRLHRVGHDWSDLAAAAVAWGTKNYSSHGLFLIRI